MAGRVRTTPLVVALSLGFGASMGLLLGLWVPPWGVAVGLAGAFVVLCIGLWREPGHRELFLVLCALSALTLGLLVATIPSTLLGLDTFVASRLPSLRSLATDSVHRVVPSLVYRWLTMAALLPVAIVLLRRDVRLRRR